MLFQKVLQPVTHILQVPVKQIRTKLCHAFNHWVKVPEDKLNLVRDVIELLHINSLL
jgi:geranylgeranyl diphosphate synthase type 3